MNATATKAKKPAKAKPINGDLLPDLQGPALRFIALDVIDHKPQVRTVFNDETLAELAEDLKTRGMLQPVLLRPGAAGRFDIIAGERRIRAARLAGLPAVPAIVGEVSEQQADDMQLAENIQREELTLYDLAAAVRKLYDREGKIAKVATIVNKSKSWVSKHLVLTCKDLGGMARRLLEDEVSEDLELLTILSNIEKISYMEAAKINSAIRAGKAGRQEARDALAQAKAKADVAKAEQKTVQKAVKKAKKPDGPPPFSGRDELYSLYDALQENGRPPIADLVAKYDDSQQALILEEIKEEYTDGVLVQQLEPIEKMRRLLNLHETDYMGGFHATAYVMGAFGVEFTLANLLAEQEKIFHM